MWKSIKKSYQQCYQQFFNKELYLMYLIYCAFPLRRLPNFKEPIEWIQQLQGGDRTRFRYYIDQILPQEIEFIQEYDIGIIHQTHPRYPSRLSALKYPPHFIFYKGNLSDYIHSIAIVGTRNVEPYGEQLTRFFTKESLALGLNIISGAARGVDQIAQEGAIKNGGRVVVVPGTGLAHHMRYGDFDKKVTLLTEFPLFFKGNRQSFPIRNRVISALALATLMIQAPEKSGAIYTANYCLQLQKPLFIPPSNLFNPHFKGNLKLLDQNHPNIHLLLNRETIEKILKIKTLQKPIQSVVESPKILGGESIMGVLENKYPHAVPFDQICEITKLSPSIISQTLLQLELSGSVYRNSGGAYQLITQ